MFDYRNSYDAYQDCVGAFGSQKVCVQLWYLDYYSNPSAISTMSCNGTTVATHAYTGRSLSCAAIGEGHVRYFTKATTYAYPNGSSVTKSGQSNSAYLC